MGGLDDTLTINMTAPLENGRAIEAVIEIPAEAICLDNHAINRAPDKKTEPPDRPHQKSVG